MLKHTAWRAVVALEAESLFGIIVVHTVTHESDVLLHVLDICRAPLPCGTPRLVHREESIYMSIYDC